MNEINFISYTTPGARPFTVTADYTVDHEVGSGGFGIVFSGTHRITNERVAIKQAFLDGRVTTVIRLLREIKALRFFDHENIISLYDIIPIVDHDFQEIYLVMDQMDCDLGAVIEAKTLTPVHIRSLTYQLLRGIKCIHSAEMIHRDIKPNNCLVTRDCQLKICDFGLAREFTGDGDMTAYVETRWYRAPEVLMQSRTYGKEIDMWSVGCTVAEMFLGQPIWKGKDAKHQIDLILQTLGAPTPEEGKFIGDPSAQRYCVASAQRWGRSGLSNEFFGRFEPEAASLLRGLLSFCPAARMDVHEALASPFVWSFRNPLDEPVTEGRFDDEIQGASETLLSLLSTNNFAAAKMLLYEEMLTFHPGLRGNNTRMHRPMKPAVSTLLRAEEVERSTPRSSGGSPACQHETILTRQLPTVGASHEDDAHPVWPSKPEAEHRKSAPYTSKQPAA